MCNSVCEAQVTVTTGTKANSLIRPKSTSTSIEQFVSGSFIGRQL
jgi:hypothetical protein